MERRNQGQPPARAPAREFSLAERLQPALVLGLRTMLGTLMALALGTLGVGMGWILFVFAGASAHSTLLTLLVGGAALGAATGGFLAWLRLDDNTPRSLLVTGAALLLAGSIGAWSGLQFGSGQEVRCCASPDITPMSYTVLGAVALTNLAALLLGVGQTLRRANLQGLPMGSAGPRRLP